MALLANRTIISIVVGFAHAKLINRHVPILPIEFEILSWRIVKWRDSISREELLLRRLELLV